VRALVTGADGFVGRHLVAHLIDAGDEVVEGIGPSGRRADERHPIDVRDPGEVARLVDSIQPTAIYHLAAVAYGPDAAADLSTALAITVSGTINVLEAASRCRVPPTVLITGSSEVYGAPPVERIDEGTTTRPVNLYGATKVAQEAVGLAFGRVHALPVIATRSFNHIGAGQRESFAVASFARQLADIRGRRRPPALRVGNLDPIRDFTDVRDVVRAYRALVEGQHAGIAVNVASGVGVSVREMLERLIAVSGRTVTIDVDAARIRPNDPPSIVGDASLLRRLTGWTPMIPLEETLATVWQDAVERWP